MFHCICSKSLVLHRNSHPPTLPLQASQPQPQLQLVHISNSLSFPYPPSTHRLAFDLSSAPLLLAHSFSQVLQRLHHESLSGWQLHRVAALLSLLERTLSYSQYGRNSLHFQAPFAIFPVDIYPVNTIPWVQCPVHDHLFPGFTSDVLHVCFRPIQNQSITHAKYSLMHPLDLSYCCHLIQTSSLFSDA